MSAPTAAQQAAADQALRWSLALAGPGRQFGPSLVPCDEDKRPIKSWEWKHEHAPKYEQSRERLVLAMRHSQFASTWAITPASDGLIVIDVDNMDYLARALEDFGPTPVFMRSRSGKVHLYYQGPPVRSHGNLYGGPREPSVEIKCEGAMIHVAGPGYVPSVPLPPRPWCDVLATRGALRSNVPMFRGERYAAILRALDVPRYAVHDGEPRYARTPAQIERCRRYLAKAGPAVQGDRGHDKAMKLLRLVGDIGAAGDVLLELALEWNENNRPPWREHEIEAKVRDAEASRDQPVGYKMRVDDDDDDESGVPDEGDAADDGELASEADENGMCAHMVAGWSSQ